MRFANWFRKYFIPHEGNEHKPHLLRWESTIAILSFILFSEIIFLAAIAVLPHANFFASIITNVLIQDTNNNRAENGFQALRVNSLLTEAAQLKVNDMAAKGYFSHVSPDGTTPWNWFDEAGYNFSYAGENLAVDFTDSQDVINAWLNSPAHRANILNKNFTEIGLATAQGTYKNQPAIFIVQFFGTPALAAVPAEMPAKTPVAVKPAERESKVIVSDIAGQENFAAVAGANAGSPTGKVETASLVNRILSDPRGILNFLYLIIATIVLLTLILKIFVRIDGHPHLIVNGAVMLIILAGTMVLNQYISLLNAKII